MGGALTAAPKTLIALGMILPTHEQTWAYIVSHKSLLDTIVLLYGKTKTSILKEKKNHTTPHLYLY